MKILSIILIMLMTFLLAPVLVTGETYQASTGNPPVSQPLVREGALAMQLTEVLQIGKPANEAEAESALSAAGIAPANGWIADYPVTPDIAVELQTAVGKAADSGKIPLGRDAALKTFQEVITGNNLPVRADTSGQGDSYASGPAYDDPSAINDYYYDQGPPAVTYYAPPPDYAYLYSWVPYPFWWWNFWFPGFFVLADFNIGVHGHGHFHGHGGFHGHGEFVSNHFRDPGTGSMSRINPVTRAHGGTFSSGTGTGWTTPSAQRGAQAIFNNSRSTGITRGSGSVVSASSNGRVSGSVSRGSTPVASSVRRTSGNPGGNVYAGSRSSVGSPFSQSAYRSSRSFAPSSSGTRSFTMASSGSRSFNASSGGLRASHSVSSFSGGRSSFGHR
ncbi:MAG TPA: hypothetical protein VEI96_08735 [Thermodesulfovibrionales bacterium]|nr:hypothetical protein [Thermodesulfovibrionales bacterium]